MNVDKHIAMLWKDDPVTCAYYIAGYLNQFIAKTIPGAILDMDVKEEDFPATDPNATGWNGIGWRNMCVRPAWELDKDPIENLRHLEQTFVTALDRWFLYYLLKTKRRVSVHGSDFEDAIRQFAFERRDVLAFYNPAMESRIDVMEDYDQSTITLCSEATEPEFTVFPEGEALLTYGDAGLFGITGVCIDSPTGHLTTGVPRIIEHKGVKHLDMPFCMRLRFHVDDNAADQLLFIVDRDVGAEA